MITNQEAILCNKKTHWRTYTYKYVENYFTEHGCKLLEEKYIGTKIPMKYKCKCGNLSNICFNSFKNGHRCIDCGKQKIREKKQFSYEEVKIEFEKRGCVLIEKEYINCDTSMKYICSCGEESIITLYKMKKGQNCQKCSIVKRSGKNHHNWINDRDLATRKKKWQRKNNILINHIHRDFKIKKRQKSYKLLGYTPQEFGEYIENHPNYQYTIDKISKTGDILSIDHIFPVKAFVDYNLDKEEYICIVNALDNLRPIPLQENRHKHDQYNEIQFKTWLKTKGIIVDFI